MGSNSLPSTPASRFRGDLALFFEPEDEASIADALELLWTSDETREALAGAGRSRAARVKALDTVSAYHRLFEA